MHSAVCKKTYQKDSLKKNETIFCMYPPPPPHTHTQAPQRSKAAPLRSNISYCKYSDYYFSGAAIFEIFSLHTSSAAQQSCAAPQQHPPSRFARPSASKGGRSQRSLHNAHDVIDRFPHDVIHHSVRNPIPAKDEIRHDCPRCGACQHLMTS